MKTPDGTRRRILVVEDESSISELCQRVFNSDGFGVDIAINGKMAQDMIAVNRYTIILTDIKMPVMDGKEFFEWLQRRHPQMINRVVFTTGSVVGKDTQDFLKSVNRPLLPKPFAPSELRTIIKGTLEDLMK